MMHVVLFIFYFLLLCIAVTRLRFFRNQIKPVYLLVFFGLHVSVGCIHNWIAFRYFPHHGDLWLFFDMSVQLKQQLMSNPAQFVKSFFATESQFNITDTSRPMLGVQYDLLIYLNVFLNIVSFNNLYINTLIFSFPVFAGSVALFKAFYTVFKKPLPALCTLLLPSTLFWTAVNYKDSLFYMAIGFFYYYFFHTNKPAFRKIILLLLTVLLMVLSRTNALISLLPALLFLFLSQKKTWPRYLPAGIMLATVIVLTVIVNAIIPGGILTAVCIRHNEFQSLTGGSRIDLPLLQPTAASFLAAFPQALLNGFLQPLPGVGGKSIYLAFSVELIIIWAIVLWGCWLLVRKKTLQLNHFSISCLVFALPGMIIIGYMVPFAGAVIRYRSIYLPFLLAPFIDVLCSYPVVIVHSINTWLNNNMMVVKPVAIQ